ncbi:MAG: ribonuclease Z [archaeon]
MAGKITLTFLGTGSTIPSPKRAHPAIVLSTLGENLLFDCGEGTQVKLQEAGINPMRISRIFITHFHPDHFLGLPGLVSSLELCGRTEPLEIFSPKGAAGKLSALVKLCNGGRLPKYLIDFRKVPLSSKPIEISRGDRQSIFSCKTSHHIPAVGYSFVERDSFHLIPEKLPEKLKKPKALPKIKPEKNPEYFSVEKGRKITYSGDTRFSEGIVRLAEGSDILIHEATFPCDKSEKAKEYCHSTPETAAQVALKARAKKLILTHFSRRISDIKEQEAAARKLFPETFCAEDLQVFEL